jgi:hypothetical protein
MKRDLKGMALTAAVAGIKIISFFPTFVEKYYSTGLYPVIGKILRIIFGWIPFSIGDIFYAVVGIWLLVWCIRFLKKLFRRPLEQSFLWGALKKVIWALMIFYISFNLMWGLNYNRLGIAYQMELKTERYSTEDLRTIVQLIADRLNQLDSFARMARPEFASHQIVFRSAIQSYQNLSITDTFFLYSSPSVKASLFGYLGNYLGFAGYYNPFSGEAQVNTTVPSFVQPFTACHEIGHQLGYAKEHEANFAGYLAAKSAFDPAVRYSVYFDLYTYAAAELYLRDSTLLKPIREHLRRDIRLDFKEIRSFYAGYENPFEPYVRRMYGRYLRANEQPQGILSYDEVTGWLVAYYKKYGKDMF